VNHSLGKEEISLDAALEHYFAEYRPKPIVLSEQIKWRKHAVVGVLIFLLLFAIYVGYQ